jgi:hypothetical protein
VSALSHIYIARGSMYHSEVRKETVQGDGDRDCSPEVGSIDPGRGSGDYCTDLRCCARSCGEYEGSNGRYAMLGRLFMDFPSIG